MPRLSASSNKIKRRGGRANSNKPQTCMTCGGDMLAKCCCVYILHKETVWVCVTGIPLGESSRGRVREYKRLFLQCVSLLSILTCVLFALSVRYKICSYRVPWSGQNVASVFCSGSCLSDYLYQYAELVRLFRRLSHAVRSCVLQDTPAAVCLLCHN